MQCVVPLAGPDLLTARHGFRPLVAFEGRPLLEAVLERRPWRARLRPEDYLFVLRDVPGLETLTAVLDRIWPGSRRVVLGGQTGGALFSVLGALALAAPDRPLVIDLADIVFTGGPALEFGPGEGAIVPVFAASDPCYSYLRIEDGRVTGAREKVVVSSHASAGVYAFRDLALVLRAAAHSIEHRATLAHRGALFVCPMVEGVLAEGLTVSAPAVLGCRPVGKAFHEDGA